MLRRPPWPIRIIITSVLVEQNACRPLPLTGRISVVDECSGKPPVRRKWFVRSSRHLFFSRV
ncbi:MAG TPA: hypothetical protein PLZ01_13720 [bacterium]|nr:hypothetical protein [bacterium]